MRRRPPRDMTGVPPELVVWPLLAEDVEDWIRARRRWAGHHGWPRGRLELIREDRRVRYSFTGSAGSPPRGE